MIIYIYIYVYCLYPRAIVCRRGLEKAEIENVRNTQMRKLITRIYRIMSEIRTCHGPKFLWLVEILKWPDCFAGNYSLPQYTSLRCKQPMNNFWRIFEMLDMFTGPQQEDMKCVCVCVRAAACKAWAWLDQKRRRKAYVPSCPLGHGYELCLAGSRTFLRLQRHADRRAQCVFEPFLR